MSRSAWMLLGWAVGAELQRDIAVAIPFDQRIVGELRHALEPLRLQRLQPRPVVEQRRADGNSDREIVRLHDRPEDAGIGRREFGIPLGHRTALSQEGDPLGQRLRRARNASGLSATMSKAATIPEAGRGVTTPA